MAWIKVRINLLLIYILWFRKYFYVLTLVWTISTPNLQKAITETEFTGSFELAVTSHTYCHSGVNDQLVDSAFSCEFKEKVEVLNLFWFRNKDLPLR